PAVLVAHGLGQDVGAVERLTRRVAAQGYVALAWSARGAGRSLSRVGIAAPDGEVEDVSALVDLLARRDDVARGPGGDPRVAVVGT
ncbi:serine aminopeptidase domain-containing protein, partial [Klebsiella pneumoniae]|uniref:serine aminopeptidase domain-containing protein n=1 Tax=Klebsiella pneumoniae TaxID=573 RepID=UPI003720FE04